MLVAVADTHALIWYLFRSPELSVRALSTFHQATETGDQIAVSAITFIEIVYLLEKGRIPGHALELLTQELQKPDALLAEVPVNFLIAKASATVPRDKIPDMPDRIIAATALHLGVPLISRDRRIHLSAVETVW